MEAEKEIEEKIIEVEVQAVMKKVKKGTLSVEREEAEKMTEKEVKENAQEVEVKAERAVRVAEKKGVGAEKMNKKMVKEEIVKVDLEVEPLTCRGLTSTMEGCTSRSWSW